MEIELLDVVNEQDKVVGQATREEVLAKGLRHRAVHVLIFNDKGEMALQLRSHKKSFCPGHWSTAVGGHVMTGESYEAAALREYEEELGEANVITPLAKDEFEAQNVAGMKIFVHTFIASHNGPFIFNKEEVADVQFFSLAQLREMIETGEKFHPELAFILRQRYL